jgi:hypothetical protein
MLIECSVYALAFCFGNHTFLEAGTLLEFPAWIPSCHVRWWDDDDGQTIAIYVFAQGNTFPMHTSMQTPASYYTSMLLVYVADVSEATSILDAFDQWH